MTTGLDSIGTLATLVICGLFLVGLTALAVSPLTAVGAAAGLGTAIVLSTKMMALPHSEH